MRIHPAHALLLLLPISLSCRAAEAAPFAVGEPAPKMRLADLTGQESSLDGRLGRVVVVDFWATWCGPCHLQAEILKRMLTDYGTGPLDIVGVNVGEDAATVRAALAADPLPYAVLLDPEDKLSAKHEILGLPSLLVIGKDGKVAYFMTGLVDGPTLRRVVDKALAG